MNMRVVFVSPVYAPYRAGMANVVREEARRLAQRGHEVHVVTRWRRGERAYEILEGVYVHRWKAWIWHDRAGWIPLFGWRVRALRPDIVHVHLPFFGVQELTGWPRSLRCVATYHMDVTEHGFVGAVARVSRRAFFWWRVRRFERVWVSSMDYARGSWLRDVWGRMESRVVELPFGVDTRRFHPVAHESRVATIQFVGAMDRAHPFKGVSVLLEALARLRERDDWRAVLVGGGDMLESYRAHAHALGIQDRAEFTGFVDDDALAARYAQADIQVVPSTSRAEAFGLVALEAQASGVPVIASDLDGVRTVVEDGVTGWLVPPNDAQALARQIVWTLDHPDLRRAAGAAARTRVEKQYDWEQHVDILERDYRHRKKT